MRSCHTPSAEARISISELNSRIEFDDRIIQAAHQKSWSAATGSDGLHYWWPKINGRMYPDGWGRFSALLIFIGFNLTFFPQFVAGYLGMPRRYHAYPPEFQVFNVLSTAGASILAGGYFVPAIWSMRYGRRAEANPWNLPGLEWRIQSPPLTENFSSTPIVTWAAYEFAPPEETEIIGKFLEEEPQKA